VVRASEKLDVAIAVDKPANVDRVGEACRWYAEREHAAKK
jgi:hypothetical protein